MNLDTGWNWPEKAFANDKRQLKKHRKGRVKNGYSEYDWWSFDTHITGLIAHAVKKFRDSGHGHPSDMTAEEFTAFCTSIIEPLEDYAEKQFYVYGKEAEDLYERAKAAMILFSERLGSWWD